MKSKIVLGVLAALSILALSVDAEAYCRWVPRHMANGYIVPGHNVCGYGNGYGRGYGNGVRHCAWRYGHRTCWYR